MKLWGYWNRKRLASLTDHMQGLHERVEYLQGHFKTLRLDYRKDITALLEKLHEQHEEIVRLNKRMDGL